jgi:molecular chaperone GrpE
MTDQKQIRRPPYVDPAQPGDKDKETVQNQDQVPHEDSVGGADSEVETLKARLAEAEAKAAQHWDQLLRAQADTENVRKRAERDAGNLLKYGAEKLLAELLSVCDSLELGLRAAREAGAPDAVVDGMELTRRQLAQVLEKHGVSVVDPAAQAFDPTEHEAMSMVPTAEVPAGHVVQVLQKGYRLHDRILRPAMVVVAQAAAEPPPATQ